MAQEYYDPWSNTKTINGLEADLVISALQKCIRRGEEDTALRMAYELYMTSTFHEEKMWNRLLVIPVEDIGFGNVEAAAVVKNLYGRFSLCLQSAICASARKSVLPTISRTLS